MTKAEYPVAEQQSREPPLTTKLPAFVMREPWLDLKMRMWLTMLMVDTPTAIGFAFTWLWFSGSISDGIGAFRTHFPGFRHADGTLDFQRFRASLRPAGCAIAGSRVSLSLAAQHGGLAPGDWGGLLVRWWFENSRAYLYYFFIVNDCQFVAGHADAWCRGIGQTAARFLCDAPFLIRRSSIFLFRESSCRCLFMKRFFCGGFDSGSG